VLRRAGAADWEPLRARFLEGLERALLLPTAGRVEPPIEIPFLADCTIPEAVAHIAVHNAHHLGQIVILRQAFGTWPPPAGSFTW
jgi:uncharacterized damage-inducible protein DinB